MTGAYTSTSVNLSDRVTLNAVSNNNLDLEGNSSADVNITGCADITSSGKIIDTTTETIESAAENHIYSASELLGGLILRDPNGSSRTDSTDTATNIVNAINGVVVNSSFTFLIQNTADAAETITLTGGSDVNVDPTGNFDIGQGEIRAFKIIITNVGSPEADLFSISDSGSGGTPGGSNTQIQYNDSNSFGGSSTLTFDGSNTMTVGAEATTFNIFGTAATSTNIAGGSLIIRGGEGDGLGNGGATTLGGGNGDVSGAGGNLTLSSGTGGSSSGPGGTLNITAGNAQGGTSTGGDVNITSGVSTGAAKGGNITLTGGIGGTTSGDGGDVVIAGGASINGDRGVITVTGNTTVTGNLTQEIGTFELTGSVSITSPRDIVVQGDLAYILFNNNDVGIYDIKDPSSPSLVNSFTPTGTWSIGATLAIVGKYLYGSSTIGDDFYIWDVSDPSNITAGGDGTITNGTSLNSANIVGWSGSYVYVAAYNNDSICSIDVSVPGSPVILDTLTDATNLSFPSQGVIVGNWLYIPSDNRMNVIDISDPYNLSITDTLNNSDFSFGTYIDAYGDYIYCVNSTRVIVVDATDKTALAIVGNLLTGYSNQRFCRVNNGYLYTTVFSESELAVFDVRDPTTPTFLYETSTSGSFANVQGMAIQGNYLYANLASATNLMRVVKINGTDFTTMTCGDSLIDTLTVNGDSNVVGNLTVMSGAQINNILSVIGRTSTASLNYDQVIYVDEKAANTAGGEFQQGAWQTRDLNTTRFSRQTTSWSSLSSNQITLQAGDYYIEASAPAFGVNRHKAKLQNITDATTTISGTSSYAASNTNSSQSHSFVTGQISISAAKTFELQHRCQVTKTNNGFGVESDFGEVEVYSEIRITKLV